MPKAKVASAYEPTNHEDYKLDPLIDALLEHLPAPGDYWAPAQRKQWLEITEKAFDLIYLETEPEPEPPNDRGTLA